MDLAKPEKPGAGERRSPAAEPRSATAEPRSAGEPRSATDEPRSPAAEPRTSPAERRASAAGKPPDPRRELGALGERLAAQHLERAGYAILERNWRCRAGELDLVAVDSWALVFCEVKTRLAGGRSGPPAPLDAVGSAKRRRLRLLAREWLAASTSPRPHRESLRFDAIGVTLDRAGTLLALDHIEDAF